MIAMVGEGCIPYIQTESHYTWIHDFQGFCWLQTFLKIFSFLRMRITFSNLLTFPYFFPIAWAAAVTWDTSRYFASLLFLSSWPPSHLASVLSHHPAQWEGSASSPYVLGIKTYRSQQESLTHGAHVCSSEGIRDASIQLQVSNGTHRPSETSPDLSGALSAFRNTPERCSNIPSPRLVPDFFLLRFCKNEKN